MKLSDDVSLYGTAKLQYWEVTILKNMVNFGWRGQFYTEYKRDIYCVNTDIIVGLNISYRCCQSGL